MLEPDWRWDVDKVYPRLKIVRMSCHCGATACKKIDGLPWRVFHIQFEGQLNPLALFSSAHYDAACEVSGIKLDGRRKPFPDKYYITAS